MITVEPGLYYPGVGGGGAGGNVVLQAKGGFKFGLVTIAAMLPEHWELRLIDMNVEPLAAAGE